MDEARYSNDERIFVAAVRTPDASEAVGIRHCSVADLYRSDPVKRDAEAMSGPG